MIDRVGVQAIQFRLHHVEPLLQAGDLSRIGSPAIAAASSADSRWTHREPPVPLGLRPARCARSNNRLPAPRGRRPPSGAASPRRDRADRGRPEFASGWFYPHHSGPTNPTCSPGRISRLTPCKTGAASNCRKPPGAKAKSSIACRHGPICAGCRDSLVREFAARSSNTFASYLTFGWSCCCGAANPLSRKSRRSGRIGCGGRRPMILLSLQKVSRQFDADPVFKGVTFEVRPGERIGLVGPNGAGKTTLLRILAGLDQPDVGDARDTHRPTSLFWSRRPTSPATARCSTRPNRDWPRFSLCNTSRRSLRRQSRPSETRSGGPAAQAVRRRATGASAARRLQPRSPSGRSPARSRFRAGGVSENRCELSGGQGTGLFWPACCSRVAK